MTSQVESQTSPPSGVEAEATPISAETAADTFEPPFTSALIARRGAPARIFPAITLDLYSAEPEADGLTQAQRAAQRILALASQPMSARQRLLGWGLAGAAPIGRMLSMHRMAFEAELAAEYQRADFFFRSSYDQLLSLAKHATPLADRFAGFADASRQQPDAPLSMDPEDGTTDTAGISPLELQQRLIDEVLIDTHCAFFNGCAGTTSLAPDNRAFAHLEHLQRLLQLAASHRLLTQRSEENLRALLIAGLETRAAICEQSRAWRDAVSSYEQLAQIAAQPDSYRESQAQALCMDNLDNLSKQTTEAFALRDAKLLAQGITQLTQLQDKIPYSLSLFQCLSLLHRMRAIKLSHATRIADALVAAETALVYNPNSAEAHAIKAELIKAMQSLQERVQELRAEIAGRRNVQLNAHGQQLLAEAGRGFKPLETYARSDAASAIKERFGIAQARAIWRQIGLTEPNAGWNERALLLLDQLDQIAKRGDSAPETIAALWAEVAEVHPELAELDATMIVEFLWRLWAGEPVKQVPTPPREAPADPPVLSAAAPKRRRRTEPIGYWLFSRYDLRIKLQLAAAITLIILASAITAVDVYRGSMRDQAYQQIVGAAARGDDREVINGAEIFLASPALSGRDERRTQVVGLYDKAIVSWFTTNHTAPPADLTQRIERYRALVASNR